MGIRAVSEKAKDAGLILGFWQAGIVGTLMVVLFPWSLLFCVFAYGLEDTVALVRALVHDAIRTALAILVVLFTIAVLVIAALIIALGSAAMPV